MAKALVDATPDPHGLAESGAIFVVDPTTALGTAIASWATSDDERARLMAEALESLAVSHPLAAFWAPAQLAIEIASSSGREEVAALVHSARDRHRITVVVLDGGPMLVLSVDLRGVDAPSENVTYFPPHWLN